MPYIKRYYNTTEAAFKMGLSENTVYDLIILFNIPHKTTNGRLAVNSWQLKRLRNCYGMKKESGLNTRFIGKMKKRDIDRMINIYKS